MDLADAIRRELRIQLTTMAAAAQWGLLPLIVVCTVAMFGNVATVPLLTWAALASAQAITLFRNTRLDQKHHRRSSLDPTFMHRNLRHCAALGFIWGGLPLVSIYWGNEYTLWLSLIISLALLSALVVILSTSHKLFFAAFVPQTALIFISIMLSPLPLFPLLPLGLIYFCAMGMMHQTLFKVQLDRVRSTLHSAARVNELSFTLENHDALTGLFNLSGLQDWLRKRFPLPELDEPVCLMVTTVKGFSDLNTLYGNEVADKLLEEVASRLVHATGGRFGIARLSGAEFALLDAHPFADPQMLEDILAALESETFVIGNRMINLVLQRAWVMGNASNFDALLVNARSRLTTQDTAMPPDPIMLRYRRELVQGFDKGLHNREIQPWYQPVIHCHTKALIGWEALARWHHPHFGIITPENFLDIARISNQSKLLTQHVLRETCRFIGALQINGQHDAACVNVNFTANSLSEEGMLDWVMPILYEHGVHASQVVMEVSEQETLLQNDQFKRNLLRMQAAGMQLAIDDFGTGYANLGHLLDLPASTVKLDKRFIDKLPHDKNSVALVRAVLTLASGLGMKTVAEGVERQDQLDFLTENGCDGYQGYLASLALPHIAALDFAQRWRGQRR